MYIRITKFCISFIVLMFGAIACDVRNEESSLQPGFADRMFIDMCGNISKYEENESGILAANWIPVEATAYDTLAKIFDMAQKMDEKINVKIKMDAFKKNLEGRNFFIVLSREYQEGLVEPILQSCNLYDFEEGYKISQPDPLGIVEKWVGDYEFERKTVKGMVDAKFWQYENAQGIDTMVGISEIKDHDELRKKTGIYGRSWYVAVSK